MKYKCENCGHIFDESDRWIEIDGDEPKEKSLCKGGCPNCGEREEFLTPMDGGRGIMSNNEINSLIDSLVEVMKKSVTSLQTLTDKEEFISARKTIAHYTGMAAAAVIWRIKYEGENASFDN